MLDAILIFIFGVSASVLALVAICGFISHVMRNRYERTCQLRIYYDWVIRKGSEEQKKLAEQFKNSKQLEALKKLVGFGILVDP
jgi:hypothetical protein